MPRIFERFIDFLWTGIAAALITGAALITLVRLLLPNIGTHRDTLERWLSALLERPITVGAISANWNGWSPRLSVEHITIVDPTTGAELLHFDHADIDIATWQSLRHLALEPQRLAVSGVGLTLLRDAAGQWSVAGMPPARAPAVRWLLAQRDFALRDADLTIIDEHAQSSYAVSGVRLAIVRHGAATSITAYVDLPAVIGRHAALELSTTGDPLDPQWEGGVNARLDGISSDFLLRQLDWHGLLPAGTPINLLLWSRWRAGHLDATDFQLSLENGNSATGLPQAARGRLRLDGDSWRLLLADIAFPRGSGSSHDGTLSAAWRPAGALPARLAVRAYDLPLAPLLALSHRLAIPPPALAQWLRTATPQGRVRQLTALWSPRPDGSARHLLDTTLAAVTLKAAGALPALANLDTHLAVNATSGYASFSDAAATVTAAQQLLQPLAVTQLRGAATWSRTADAATMVRARALSASINGIAVGLDGDVTLVDGQTPLVDLRATLATANAARLHELLPRHLLHEHGEIWARHIFQSGRIDRSSIVLKGPLDRFPFNDGSGEFAAEFTLSEAVLRYSLQWPDALNFGGTVAVDGQALKLAIAAGNIRGADIAGAVVEVPDLITHERMLHISGTARGPASSAIAIIRESPLKSGSAARVQELDIDGDIEVALDLNLALYDNGPHEVLGQARFNGNHIAAARQGITLDRVVGAVNFTHGDWYGEGLSANFEGTPVELVVNGGLDDPNYESEFRMRGVSAADGLVHYLEKYAPPLHAWLRDNQRLQAITGQVPWQAVLTIPRTGRDREAPQQLTIDSSLDGLAVDLPWPFGKRADEHLPLHIGAAIRDHLAVATRIDLGQTMNLELEAGRDADGQVRLTRAEAIFGSLDPQFKQRPGVSLTGYIASLPMHDWSVIAQHTPPPGADATASLPVTFDVQVSDLQLLGRSFRDVRLQGVRGVEQWQVTVASAAAAGRLLVPRASSDGAMQLDFDQLHLAPAATASAGDPTTDLDPRRLPAFTLHCADFSYGTTALGQAEIVTARRADGLTLERLRFSDAGSTISATGTWLVADEVHRSQFDIDVTSTTLAGLLQRFGYRVANIKHGRTAMSIHANWAGTPADFTLARINGSFELAVDNGRFLDIDPGTGRLFGLLSLQTLPRRLSLDFEDLFDQGFAFDHIGGVFQLEDGNAYTNSLTMEGPSARINVAGRIGLAEKDYDQHIVVTPALSNSLPLAGALFGPIGWGAGAAYFLGGKMFKALPEHVNKFLRREYSITGAWDHPIIEKN